VSEVGEEGFHGAWCVVRGYGRGIWLR
jgi:hypothetical protein